MSWKVATYNANSIRARLSSILDWLDEVGPDLLCIQETKVQDKDFPVEALAEAGYGAFYLGQKSYNGVAVLSRREPDEVIKGFPDGFSSDQARMISVRVGDIWIVNTYVPQGRDPLDPAFQFKLEFFERLLAWFETSFDPTKPMLWLGDLNVAPEPLDVYDPERLEGEVGFHPMERKALEMVANWGFTDLFRLHHPEDRQFTFWDYRLPASFKRNLGWRIDHIMATDPLVKACVGSFVDAAPRAKPKPSDHTYLVAEFDLDI